MLCALVLLSQACVDSTLAKLKDAAADDDGDGDAGGKNGSGAGKGGSSGKGMSGSGGKGGTGGASAMSTGGKGSSGSGGMSGSGASGSGGDSGKADAGSTKDAGGTPGDRTYSTNRDDFFGDPRCDRAGVLFCDDFESGDIDGSKWSNMLAPPSVDGMQHARGTKALHVSTSGVDGSGLKTTSIFPVAGGKYYGRLFVYFDALPTDPDGAHWTIIGANSKQGDDDMSEIRVGGQLTSNDGNVWGIGTDGGPTGDWTNHDRDNPKSPPLKQWTCIEWMHDSEKDETKLWVDGKEHSSLATTASVEHGGNSDVEYDIPETGSVWVGFWNYFGTPDSMQFDTFIDEVALDDERIGCDL
jgi:hypothetical protein